MILKPDTFEGLRFDFTRPLNQNFAICHSLFAGNVEVPTNNAQVIKMPMGTYEFGANLVSNQVSGKPTLLQLAASQMPDVGLYQCKAGPGCLTALLRRAT